MSGAQQWKIRAKWEKTGERKEKNRGRFFKKACALLWLSALTGLVLCGCNTSKGSKGSGETSTQAVSESEPVSREIFAMDTYMTLSAYGENAEKGLDAAVDEINRIDDLLSTGNSSSEIYQLNQKGKGTVSEETGYLIQRSKELYESTGGVFDITVYPVMKAWGFTTGDYRIPGKTELKKLLSNMGADRIQYDEKKQEVTLKSGTEIDLGGIGKGYTSSRVMEIFREYGIENAVISLGGNVQALNDKPDGSAWKVAVEDPEDTSNYLGILSVKNKAVITSGGYERYFEKNGKTYHHIIDPSTGYPTDSGLTSVTIVSEDGTLADGLSTSLFIMGPEKAKNYWKKHSEEFDAILVKKDGTIQVTEGIANDFSSDSKVTVIKKK